MAMIMTLTQEISVLRDRLDTIEKLLVSKKAITLEDIETFEPDDDLVEEEEIEDKCFKKSLAAN